MENTDIQMVTAAGILAVCSMAMGARILAKKRNRKPRSCWVKPWREERQRCGNVQTLLKEFNLSNDLKDNKSYILMDELCFSELLSYIEADITRKDTTMRASVPAKERLASTLRFLATGESFQELNENTKLSPTFLRNNIIEVSEVICRKMKDKYLKMPDSKEKWLEIAEGFESLWQFPHCLGALDAKHIAFTPTKEEEPLFHTDKGFRGIVLLAMCDANCKFTFVDIGSNGCISDCDVLMRSSLMEILNQAETELPNPDLIGNKREAPYVIVAKNSFPNMGNMITPYSRTYDEKDIINFNTRLSRAHQNIERTFRVLANRFKILQTKIKLNAEKTKKILECCCVLHNFLLEKSLWYRQNLTEIAISNGSNVKDNHEMNEDLTQKDFESVRKVFVDYFSNEGNFEIN